MLRQRTLSRYGRPTPPSEQNMTVPACVGGVNAVDSLMEMPGRDCIYTFNLMPSEYGMRLRRGWREWATGCNGDVGTIIPYEAKDEPLQNNRLFAATQNGIYDVTLFGTTAPVEVATFTENGDKAGKGVYVEFTGDAAGTIGRGHCLFYADPLNGLWRYSEETGLWEQPVGGINPGMWYYNDGTADVAFPVEDVAFVTIHKQRLWVILEGDDDAWYLPVAASSGQLQRFTFGSKMPNGGKLVGLYNWTVDGGDGVDDFLVAVGRGGDVIPYQGSDPALPDWQARGVYYIGQVPDSRRIARAFGPDLFLLSTFGLVSTADLLRGGNLLQGVSRKVNRFLRSDVEDGKDLPDWQMTTHPGDGFMQIITPKPASSPYVQYNLNLQTGAWGFWKDVPALSGASWLGEYMVGSTDGRVLINDSDLDGTTLDPAGFDGDPVEFETMTAFMSPQGHPRNLRVGFVRSIGVISGPVSININAVYDYQVEATIAPSLNLPFTGQSRWDSAVWNEGLWDYRPTGGQYTSGALGMGNSFAIHLRGRSSQRLTLVGWDVSFTAGGFL